MNCAVAISCLLTIPGQCTWPICSAFLRFQFSVRRNRSAPPHLVRGIGFFGTMIAQKRGAILNVSSSAGFLPLPELGVYAATKAYVTSFSEAIRAETRGRGITVTALCPGPVHTEFAQVADREVQGRKVRTSPAHVSVEEVARAGLSAIERDQALVVPGIAVKILMTIVRALPLAVLRAAWRFRGTNEVGQVSANQT